MDYVAESKQDFADSLRFCRGFEVLSPLPLNERPKALSTDAYKWSQKAVMQCCKTNRASNTKHTFLKIV